MSINIKFYLAIATINSLFELRHLKKYFANLAIIFKHRQDNRISEIFIKNIWCTLRSDYLV